MAKSLFRIDSIQLDSSITSHKIVKILWLVFLPNKNPRLCRVYRTRGNGHCEKAGFSIGSDMDSASLSDMLLPSGLSFLFFYITTAIAARKKTAKLSKE